jgi:hypothetical protein
MIMGKFIITETEKKYIRGLYEQPTNDLLNQKSGCTGNPNSNNLIMIDLFITRSLIDKNNTWINSILSETLSDYTNSSPYKIGFDFETDVPTSANQRRLQFQIQPTYNNSLRQTGWLEKFFGGFTTLLKDTLMTQLQLDEKYFKMVGPKYTWGNYFESEPTNCPDLCIGVSYRIDYNPPLPYSGTSATVGT